MTSLVTPAERWYDSWVETLLDFGTEFPHGSGNGPEPVGLDPASFASHVAERLRYADPAATLEPGRVPCTYFWVVDDAEDHPSEVVGFLALRHRLNDWLLEEGGHIGYSIRPARRRRGHAGRALGLALHEAAQRDLEQVLVTCEKDNEASRRVIESWGGVLEDMRHGRRRYWLRTADGSGPAPD